MLEALDVRLLRRSLACSWGSLFTCNTTAAIALFYIAKRAARARACRCSCFLSHFASLFRDAFRLCRRSAFDSAGASSLCLVSAGSLALFLSLPATWRSALAFACSAPVSALFLSHLCLGYASRSSRATSTEHLFFNASVHITVKEYE